MTNSLLENHTFFICSTHLILTTSTTPDLVVVASSLQRYLSISLSLHGHRVPQPGGQWSHLFSRADYRSVDALLVESAILVAASGTWLNFFKSTIILNTSRSVISASLCPGCLNVSQIKYHLEPLCHSLTSISSLATAAFNAVTIVIDTLPHILILFRGF